MELCLGLIIIFIIMAIPILIKSLFYPETGTMRIHVYSDCTGYTRYAVQIVRRDGIDRSWDTLHDCNNLTETRKMFQIFSDEQRKLEENIK